MQNKLKPTQYFMFIIIKMVSDWENNFVQNKYKSGWGIETFYLYTKNTNLGLSTIHLVGVDMIEIANVILIIETYFYMI